MPIHLTIFSPSAPEASGGVERRFDEDTIVLGRSPEAHVRLNDPSRVVSKQHAEIRRTPDGYVLVDLGSKNFTFLEGNQLDPGHPRLLQDGDTVQIGDHRIEVALLPDPVAHPGADAGDALQETVFAADFTNPFEDPVADLIQALDALAAAYDREAPSRRDDALRDACRRDATSATAGLPSGHPGVEQALSLLRLTPSTQPPASPTPSAPAPSSPAPSAPLPESGAPDPAFPFSPLDDVPSGTPPSPGSQTPSFDAPRFGDDDPNASGPNSSRSGASRSDADDASNDDPPEPEPFIAPEALPHVPPISRPHGATGSAPEPERATPGEVTMELVRAVSRLITLPWQFRHEFIGQTILQAPESAFLYDTPESLYESLLGDRVSPEERGERLGYLRKAVNAVAVHQVAMLDGYKASVTTGAEQLLRELDPETHLDAVQAESALYRMLPPLAASAALQRLADQFEDVQRGAWSAAEHRVFRPAFIKAYLARMTAA